MHVILSGYELDKTVYHIPTSMFVLLWTLYSDCPSQGGFRVNPRVRVGVESENLVYQSSSLKLQISSNTRTVNGQI